MDEEEHKLWLSGALPHVYKMTKQCFTSHDTRELCQTISGKKRVWIYILRQALWASGHGSWVIPGAEVLVMHRLVTCGHRFFWRTFAIPVVLPRSQGYLKVTVMIPSAGYMSIELS